MNTKPYSYYQIKQAKNKKVVRISKNTYYVSNEKRNSHHIVIYNGRGFRCDCDHNCDNKQHTRMCSCSLAVLHAIDKKRFWDEIYNHRVKNENVYKDYKIKVNKPEFEVKNEN